jgi:hypothetical protein
MSFSENLRSICSSDITIMVEPCELLRAEGLWCKEDIQIKVNLTSGEATPLSYDDLTIPWLGMFWGALRVSLHHYKNEESFMIRLTDSDEIIYSENPGDLCYVHDEDFDFSKVDIEALDQPAVFQIFSEAVKIITDKHL